MDKSLYKSDLIDLQDIDIKIGTLIDEKESSVEIIATLTSAFCPFADDIISSITQACLAVENVHSANVEITFEPPFTIDSVPEATKAVMGW